MSVCYGSFMVYILSQKELLSHPLGENVVQLKVLLGQVDFLDSRPCFNNDLLSVLLKGPLASEFLVNSYVGLSLFVNMEYNDKHDLWVVNNYEMPAQIAV